MRKLFLFLIAGVSLSSCSRYYVSTLESSNTIKNEATGEFKFENDTLAITYNFHGDNAPISIELYNKLNEPLYVNWQKSALIKGDRATSYSGKQITFNAELSGSSLGGFELINGLQTTDYDAKISGAATLQEEISFIPPKSRITKIPLKLAQIDYKAISDTLYQRSYIPLAGRPGVWGKEATFNSQNSPLNFKSYLTLYTQKENKQQIFYLRHFFYITNLIKTGQNQKVITALERKPGILLYYSETTGYGKAMNGVGIGALAAGAAAADLSLNKNEKKGN
jgi:hypothetical protein